MSVAHVATRMGFADMPIFFAPKVGRALRGIWRTTRNEEVRHGSKDDARDDDGPFHDRDAARRRLRPRRRSAARAAGAGPPPRRGGPGVARAAGARLGTRREAL